jgi:diguanylate cyclase (GGDEF)-like protein
MQTTHEAIAAAGRGAVRFTLLQRLVIGYTLLALFILAALLFSARGLYSLNSTARDIATNHLPAINSLTKLRNSLIAQEGYAGKYVIFRSNEFRELFLQREKDSRELLSFLERTGPPGDTAGLVRLFGEYRVEADRLFAGGDEEGMEQAASKIFSSLEELYASRQRDLQRRLEAANREEHSSLVMTIGFSLTGLFLAIVIAVTFTYRTFSTVRKLQRATQRIAEGDFAYDPQIPAGDELGDLAEDFSRMALRLKELEQMSLDASPLTRLPGNIAIERVIEHRLQGGERFALCYADLDNFKPFTDTYGYAKGSELIRLTAEIIHEAVRANAPHDPFVGHIGGDDFVMVLSVEDVVPVCEAVIRAFDAEVIKHYTPEDLVRGGIQGADRYGVQRFFPIMTVSIAVIINEAGEFSTSVELAKTAAEIKDYAKEKPGSNYLISHRRKKPR